MKRKSKATYGWAWKIAEGLCHWSMPYRRDLIRDGKPSPEAKAVRVRITEVRPKAIGADDANDR